MFGVVRVKNHDFTTKNQIFSNFRGGARRVRPPLPGSAPDFSTHHDFILTDVLNFFFPSFLLLFGSSVFLPMSRPLLGLCIIVFVHRCFSSHILF
jgi:hypothetical protein